MRIRIVFSFVVVFVFCISSMAEAQQRQRGRQGGGISRGRLIQVEAVQKELEVSDEQKTELEGLRGNRRQRGEGEARPERGQRGEGKKRERGQRGEGKGGAEGKKRERGQQGNRRQGGGRSLEQVQAEIDAISEVLLPHQVTRLNEIYIQVMGQNAIQDPVVAEALGITEDQQEEMRDARSSAMESLREEMQELRDGGDREAMREKMQELRKSAGEQVMDVLNSSQKKKLEALKGDAFDMPEDAMPQRGGRNRDRQRADF